MNLTSEVGRSVGRWLLAGATLLCLPGAAVAQTASRPATINLLAYAAPGVRIESRTVGGHLGAGVSSLPRIAVNTPYTVVLHTPGTSGSTPVFHGTQPGEVPLPAVLARLDSLAPRDGTFTLDVVVQPAL